NQLAIDWIQFQLDGWVSHRQEPLSSGEAIKVDLAADDPYRQQYGIDHMIFRKTQYDPIQTPGKQTYRNENAAWGGASQIYGSDQPTQDQTRYAPGTKQFLPNGHMYLDDKGLLPLDAKGREFTGNQRNWWVGRTVFHTLFVKNHNYICDFLKKAHP